jgi:two-component system nitrate/nitrite response regulator NarL
LQQKPSAPAIPDTPLSELTPREREIIAHLAEGQSNKAIARDLGISDGTVKLHVKAILRKLNVRSRVEAAVIAVEQGLGRKQSR